MTSPTSFYSAHKMRATNNQLILLKDLSSYTMDHSRYLILMRGNENIQASRLLQQSAYNKDIGYK